LRGIFQIKRWNTYLKLSFGYSRINLDIFYPQKYHGGSMKHALGVYLTSSWIPTMFWNCLGCLVLSNTVWSNWNNVRCS
jgi:hypothetical protein